MMQELIYLFPVVIIIMGIPVLYILSRKGWKDLADQYHFEGEFTGNRVGIISATINGVNYNNALVLKYDYTGFYLRPIFIFRLFHKPLFIPWKEIETVRDKTILFVHVKELLIGRPTIAIMQLTPGTFAKIASFIK